MCRWYGDRCYLQRFLFRACLGAAVEMGRFEMNWEDCFMVCDHCGTELGVLWPPELTFSTGTKLLGGRWTYLVAQLKLNIGLGDLVSLLKEMVFCSSLEAGYLPICASLAMKGFASVPGSESLMDQAVMCGHIMTKWKLGFPLIPVFLRFFPGSLGIVSASK